jgi:diguanylate cyclase (GGDEF)-like protein
MRLRSLLPALFLLATGALASESGFPLITLFRQEQHKGGTQNFDVARDPRGRLYFANLEGILVYDGAWWTRVEIPRPAAFSVTADRQGRVGVTLLDDIGVLSRGPSGALAYRSLTPLLPPELRRGMGQGDTCVSGDGLLFSTERFIARWDGTTLRVLDRTVSPHTRRCFEIAGRTWLASWTGVEHPDGAKTFAGKRIDIILPGIVIVRNEGMFHFDGTPYTTDASVWLRGKGVMDSLVLRDGRIAVATLRHGLLVMKPDGTIDQIIDAAAGLPDVFLFGVEEDDEGSLWLAMDTGIVRVDFGAPVTVFDQRLGLIGSVQALARHHGTLYAGTPHGIFALDSNGGSHVRARRIPSPEGNNPWKLLSSHGDLLAGTYGGVLVLHDDAPARLIDGTSDQIVYEMTPSLRDPSLLWLAMDTGLGTLRREGGGWRYEGVVPKSVPYVHSIVEAPDGSIWYGTNTDGIIHRHPDGTMTRYGGGEASVISAAGRIVLVTREGFFQPGPRGTLVPDPLLGHIRSSEVTLLAAADARGNIWMSTRPPRVVRRQPDGTYEREAHAIGAMDGDGQLFYGDDPDGTMWIGGERGLYRIAPLDAAAARPQPVPAIRRVVDGADRVLFDGAVPGAAPAPPSLPHDFGRVRIEVAPLSYRAKLQYQYRLDPADSAWSPWTDQAFLDYTNLAANEYTFRVRTRGAAGAMSAEARWRFAVRAPWYATRWAAALWVLLGVLLLGAIVWIRTRTLRLRARQLQSQVDEQTVMLRHANAQLERLSLADPLTGVANRRAFDRALGEAWKRAIRHDQPLAIIMLDLDHFKLLNDSRGHTAGDEVLRAVAQTLESAIRGNGDDLVARWGGEEFVILLGAADEASALAVAQRIRLGIETHGVTASLGVAIRGNDADPIALIDRADRALYAAKRSGRNRVELDEQRRSA